MNTSKNSDAPAANLKNHSLATVAVVLALLGVMLAEYGLALVIPSLAAAFLGWRSIQAQPQVYTGKIFIYAALLLNLLLVGIFAAFLLV